MNDPTTDTQKGGMTPKHSRTTLAVLWLILIAAGYALIERWGQDQINAAEIRLQTRLQQQAAQKAASIEDWLQTRIGIITTMADNSSLRLYASQISSDDASMQPAQAERIFLRNYLISMAGQYFISAQADALSQISANLDPVSAAGIGLFNPELSLLTSTLSMPNIAAFPLDIRQHILSGERLISGPHSLKKQPLPLMLFSTPVYGIQSDNVTGSEIGYLIGISPLKDDFFNRLENAVQPYESEEALLVRRSEDTIRYISKWSDESLSMLSLDGTHSELVSRRLLDDPSRFVKGLDYDGNSVYAAARTIDGTDWLLINKIDSTEALAHIRGHVDAIRTGYILAALTLSFAMIALWRHASALRSNEMAEHYRQMAHRIEKHEQLLDLITSATPAGMVITNWDHEYCYANATAADHVRMKSEDLIGRSMLGILGKDNAELQIKASRAAAAENKAQTYVAEEKEGDRIIRAVRRQHIPLENIPLPDEEERIPGILIVEEDITDVAKAQDLQKSTLRHLIQTLVDMVDQRDPHAAHHSASVAHIARAIAREMELDEPMIDTIHIAGQLMNIGKVSIPKEWLTADSLTKEQVVEIRDALQSSVNYLERVPFGGPVIETIRQSQERMDGSGPMGLSGEDILISARITAAANSFVAMTSDRAYRAGQDIDDALKELMQSIDTLYDRKVIAALVSYIDNRGGREEWAAMYRE